MEESQIAESASPFKKCGNVECDGFVDIDMSNLYCSQNCMFIVARKERKEREQEEKALEDINGFGKAVDTLKDVAQIGTRALLQIATLKVYTQEGEILKQIALQAYKEIEGKL